MQFENIMTGIALHEGSLNTIWGPCSDGSKFQCDCKQCRLANKIEELNLDYSEEYDKASKNCFASPDYFVE